MVRSCFLLFSLLPFLVFQQEKEKQFVKHLVKNGFYNEAEYFINHRQTEKGLVPELTYALAISYKKSNQALLYEQTLVKIRTQGSMYFNANLLLQNYYLQTGNLEQAEKCFFTETDCSDSLVKLQQLNSALFYAVKREYTAFKLTKEKAINENSPYISNLNQMDESLQKIRNYKKKKPFIGGLLSAIVPGLGKVYAKKPKQGLTALLTVAVFGLQGIEMYKHGGFKNPGVYIYGSVFTAFYLGNILGGVHAVKKHNYDYIKEQEYELLQQADYPFRSIGL